MNLDLEELRSLAQAVDVQKWSIHSFAGKSYVTRDGLGRQFVAMCQNRATAEYIAAISPTTALLLLETIEQQAARITALEQNNGEARGHGAE